MKTEKNSKTDKGKKNKPTARQQRGESVAQMKRAFALGNRRRSLEKEKRAAERERRQVFLRRTKAASGKKAARTARTRAYYRFAKSYPANVDEAGFRENAPPQKKKRRILLILLCAALAFCLAFVAARTCMLLSREPPPGADTADTQPEQPTPLGYYRFSYSDYEAGNTDAMLETLRANGCGAALFEIKSESGYVNLSAPGLALAGRREVTPDKTLAALKAAGMKTCAYISCFLDPLAAAWEPGMAVTRADGGVWTDNAGAGWLNPFSERARTYLTGIVSAAAQAGFDAVLLDNVCFSTDSGTASAVYPGEENGPLSRNGALNAFVSQAAEAAGGAQVILMSRYPAFDPVAALDAPGAGGNLLQTAAGALCVDARLSRQPKNCTVGTSRFADPAAMPFVFTLAVCDFTRSGVSDALSGADVLACLANDETLGETLEAARLSGVAGYVIW